MDVEADPNIAVPGWPANKAPTRQTGPSQTEKKAGGGENETEGRV